MIYPPNSSASGSPATFPLLAMFYHTGLFAAPHTQCLMPWALYICHSPTLAPPPLRFTWVAAYVFPTSAQRHPSLTVVSDISPPLLPFPLPSSLCLGYGPKSFGNLGALNWISSAWWLRSEQKFSVFLSDTDITMILLMSNKKWETGVF